MTVHNLKRNVVHTAMTSAALVAGLVSALVIVPMSVTAGPSDRMVFQDKTVKAAIGRLTGNAIVTKTDKVAIIAPEIAELGREVGIKVRNGGLKNVQSITLLAPKNTTPMVASFGIPEGTKGFIRSRVKLRESMNVIALVKADGKFYTTSKFVKITEGGCGGGK